MASDVVALLPGSIIETVRIVVIVTMLMQVVVYLVFFRQVQAAATTVHTQHIAFVRTVFYLYILLLLGILIFVIVY